MAQTGIIQDDLFLQHDTGPYHPERKERLVSIYEGLRSYPHHSQLRPLKARPATESELGLIHPRAHIRKIQDTAGREFTQLDPDTISSAQSFEVARCAVGSLLVLIDALFAGEIQNGFAFVRPPGHHAEPDRAMGFCLFSNIAIGAAYALQKYKLSRVLVVDFDVHHGNGTQKAFYSRQDVLYVSTHQFPLYPGTGDFPEIGEGSGRGFTVNFPLPSRTEDATYKFLFEKVILAIGRTYRPELLLVSAGYDAYVEDPLAGMEVTPDGFCGISQSLVRLGNEVCGGKTIFLLEGGYHLKGLQTSVLRSLDVLTGNAPKARQWETTSDFEAILTKSRRMFSPYWKF
jgi:acetoin utilization deacetylase AcuC-like enzyme